jgi:hypothetical protein
MKANKVLFNFLSTAIFPLTLSNFFIYDLIKSSEYERKLSFLQNS